MLLGPLFWAQSLETIVLIALNRCWRISSACKHANLTNDATCTLPSFDRPKLTRLYYPTLYSQRLGVAITQTVRQISHSTNWGNVGSQILQCKNGYLLLLYFPCNLHNIVPSRRCSETKMSWASLQDARSLVVILQMLVWSLF